MMELLDTKEKSKTVLEVEQQGVAAMALMTKTIQEADGIYSPPRGNSSGTLSLDVLDGMKDPTMFDSADGVLRLREASGAYIPLTSSQVQVTSLQFTNVSQLNTPGAIRVEFTLSRVNVSGKNEYDYTKTFYTTAALQ